MIRWRGEAVSSALLAQIRRIDPERVGEIREMFLLLGDDFAQDFADGKMAAVRFTMPVGGFPVTFLLPANVDGSTMTIVSKR